MAQYYALLIVRECTSTSYHSLGGKRDEITMYSGIQKRIIHGLLTAATSISMSSCTPN